MRLPSENAPETVNRVLDEWVQYTKQAFGDDLVSIVLFGSAAEGRMRLVSDVNAIVVVKRFVPRELDGMRESTRSAYASIRLRTMFLLESEIAEVSESFAVKFSDVGRRHRVLWGKDVFASLQVPRQAICANVRQTLMNLMLRLRERYALVSLREEQLATVAPLSMFGSQTANLTVVGEPDRL